METKVPLPDPNRDTKPDGDPEEIDHGMGMSRGGRKKRKKGGHAEGHMAHHRLDRTPRKAGGGRIGNNPYSTAAKMKGPIEDVAGTHYSGKRAENNATLPEEREGHAGGGRTTPSGGVKASYRHKAEAKGHTMKGGSFPIEDAHDLANAKHDVGRAKNPEAARRWINKRAHELGEPPLGG